MRYDSFDYIKVLDFRDVDVFPGNTFENYKRLENRIFEVHTITEMLC